MEKIDKDNINLKHPDLINEYKDMLLRKKLKKIFDDSFQLSADGVDDILTFYNSVIKARADKCNFKSFIDNNKLFTMNHSCMRYASILKKFAAYVFKLSEKDINHHFPEKNIADKLYQSVMQTTKEIQIIEEVSKQKLMEVGVLAIPETFINDINPLYFSEELQPKGFELIQEWVQSGNIEKIAELSNAMVKKEWYQVTCIIEKEEGENINIKENNI